MSEAYGSHPALGSYRPFAWLADHLTREGIAVLRFDEWGVGESGGDQEMATSADFADDNEAALHYLLARDEINPEGIGFLGHSEGAMIAAMVTARDPNVAFVISMAGAAVPGEEVLLVQIERIARASGMDEEEIAEALRLQRTLMDLAGAEDWEAFEALLYETLLEQIQELLEEAREAIEDPEAVARERASIQLEGFQSPWFQFFLSYDPAEDWRQITVPVLALFGELDTQVDVEQNRPALEAVLAGNKDVIACMSEAYGSGLPHRQPSLPGRRDCLHERSVRAGRTSISGSRWRSWRASWRPSRVGYWNASRSPALKPR
jgi:uncharacterized protein